MGIKNALECARDIKIWYLGLRYLLRTSRKQKYNPRTTHKEPRKPIHDIGVTEHCLRDTHGQIRVLENLQKSQFGQTNPARRFYNPSQDKILSARAPRTQKQTTKDTNCNFESRTPSGSPK